MNDIDVDSLVTYQKLAASDLNSMRSDMFVQPKSHQPTPSQTDYSRGYITRYFCQRVNDEMFPVIEISEQIYRSVQLSVIYRSVSLQWRISGPINEVVLDSGIIDDIGVTATNINRIAIASDTISMLTSKLQNPIEFHAM